MPYMSQFIYKTTPYAHQVSALKMSCDKEAFALFMEMGCGKSKVVIDNFAKLYNDKKLNGVLIVAPKGVYDNWFTYEIPTHLPDQIPRSVVKWSNANTCLLYTSPSPRDS